MYSSSFPKIYIPPLEAIFFLNAILYSGCNLCFGGWWFSVRITHTVHSPPPLFSFCLMAGHFTAHSVMCQQAKSDKLTGVGEGWGVLAKCTVKWAPVRDWEDAVSSCAPTTYQIRQQMGWLPCIWAWKSHSSLIETSALLLIVGVTVGRWINLNSSQFIDLNIGNDNDT